MKDNSIILEALLFVKTEPLSKKKIAEFLKTDLSGAEKAISELREKLEGRGVRLIENGDEVMLGTASEASEAITATLKEEITRDLGRAGLETISIVLYKGPVTKSSVDFIRGVNSQFVIRNLLVRGLIERIPNPDGRGALYQPTFELLRYMGTENVRKLPDYESIRSSLNNFEEKSTVEENEMPDEPKTEEDNA